MSDHPTDKIVQATERLRGMLGMAEALLPNKLETNLEIPGPAFSGFLFAALSIVDETEAAALSGPH
jgi:hypothetical protein